MQGDACVSSVIGELINVAKGVLCQGPNSKYCRTDRLLFTKRTEVGVQEEVFEDGDSCLSQNRPGPPSSRHKGKLAKDIISNGPSEADCLNQRSLRILKRDSSKRGQLEKSEECAAKMT